MILDESGYQEVLAGTIPVKAVLALTVAGRPSSVIVRHERGYLTAFDEHLDRLRDGAAPDDDVDYQATWAAITDDDDRPAVLRLELRFAGLNCRPRLAFTGPNMRPLWLLCDGAQLLINTEGPEELQQLPLALSWGLGVPPGIDDLRELLTLLGVPRPPPPPPSPP